MNYYGTFQKYITDLWIRKNEQKIIIIRTKGSWNQTLTRTN